ncbi:helix-turn-helix domain-containing protein [Agrilactobacillus fermenti]|uniref:helix-turn-helix domain-containing protein n=1 Tax=Agrilactobacillus fermenti TaxID=2586909 RepID=UPI003A5BB7CF
MNLLVAYRKKRDLSQKEFSERLDISASYYNQIENQTRNPSFNVLRTLAKVFPDFDINAYLKKYTPSGE